MDVWKTEDLTDNTIGPAIEALRVANQLVLKELEPGEKSFYNYISAMDASEVALILAFQKNGFNITYESVNRVIAWVQKQAAVVAGIPGKITWQNLELAKAAIDLHATKRTSPHAIDPNAKPGRFIEDSRAIRAAEKAAAEAAAQAAAAQAGQPKQEESMWQTIAKKLRYEGTTHGRKQQMADLYAAGENGTRTWREVGYEMDRLFHTWQRVGN